MFSLLSGTALMLPDLAVASGIFSTHKSTPQPEPASSLIDMSRSYKTAGICFLGVGDCDPNVGFGKAETEIIPLIQSNNVKTRVSQNKTAVSWKKLTAPVLTIPDMDWAAGAKRH